MVMVLPETCMSCFEQASLVMPPNCEFISLSVVASTQCCMACGGRLRPSKTIFISHNPALRVGSSAADAVVVKAAGAQAVIRGIDLPVIWGLLVRSPQAANV